MKKLFALSILAVAIFVSAPATQARADSSPAATEAGYAASPTALAQVRVYYRTVTRRVGRRYYRETYRIARRPNGRIVTRLVSRVRIR